MRAKLLNIGLLVLSVIIMSCKQNGPITMNLYYTGQNGSALKFVQEMESTGTADAIRQDAPAGLFVQLKAKSKYLNYEL